MELNKALQHLYAEREKLERVIATLEDLLLVPSSQPGTAPALKRKGRKAMDPTERQEVSKRMKKYWAGRRQQAAGRSTMDSGDGARGTATFDSNASGST